MLFFKNEAQKCKNDDGLSAEQSIVQPATMVARAVVASAPWSQVSVVGIKRIRVPRFPMSRSLLVTSVSLIFSPNHSTMMTVSEDFIFIHPKTK